MIIVDLNQIMYSTVVHTVTQYDAPTIDEGLVRHIALNIIRSIRNKFKNDFGELVIATDSYKYWRRDYFPYYKANRKKNRDKSSLDWPSIFNCMNTLKAELKQFFPYKYIEVEGAEADDIIAALVHRYRDEDILIISGDKDFVQLHKFDNVKQYDAVNKKFIKVSDPLKTLNEHILKGDVGDGIPNVVSPDNCFVLGERQKRLTKGIQESLVAIQLQTDHPLYRNYIRNKTLIDLECIPDQLRTNIIKTFEEQTGRSRSHLMNYFIKNKLKTLMESINDF